MSILLLVLLACDDTVFGTGPGPDTDATGWCAAEEVFANDCASCHSGTESALSAPDLADDPRAAIVGQVSVNYPDRTYVVPGDPDASFLYLKITGGQGVDEGSDMPLGSALDASSIAAIADWIRAGATDSCDPTDTGGDTGGDTAAE